MMVSFEEDLMRDDWLMERWLDTVLWRARLSGGRVAVFDDGHPGRSPYSSWLRLAEYLQETGQDVVSLKLTFHREVVQPVPDNAAGYFFRRMALCSPGSKVTHGFYLVGYLMEGASQIQVQTWKVPELLLEEVEFRPIDHEGLVGPSLIRRQHASTR